MRSKPGHISGGVGCACKVGERVEANNIATRVVSPLEDLGSDVDEEGHRGPKGQDMLFLLAETKSPLLCERRLRHSTDLIGSCRSYYGIMGRPVDRCRQTAYLNLVFSTPVPVRICSVTRCMRQNLASCLQKQRIASILHSLVQTSVIIMRVVTFLLVLVALIESSAASAQPAKQDGLKWFQRSVAEEKKEPAPEKEEKKRPAWLGRNRGSVEEEKKEPEKEEEKKPKPGLFSFGGKRPEKEEDEDRPEESKKEGRGATKKESTREEAPKEEDSETQPERVTKQEPKPKEPPKNEENDEKQSKPTRFRFGVRVQEKKDTTKVEEEDEVAKPSTNTTVEDKKEVEPVNVTRPEEKEAKKTAAPPSSMRLPPSTQGMPLGYPMQQQPGNGLIIMGLDGRPQRGVPAGRNPPGQPTSSSALIAEAVATVISTGIRFWFLTSLTRWFAEEEIKSLKKPTQHFLWERLNDRYIKDSDALQTALRTPPANVPERKWRRHVRRQLRKEQRLARQKERVAKKDLNDVFDRTVVVVELATSEKGDFDMSHLEGVVTFILAEHRRKAFGAQNTTAVELEVIILVESPGGGVSEFGLGAAQIRRLTAEEGIFTTVCVDKVAASGGYMIASQANKVIAAPFAVVGSIGVIREGLNFNKALQKYGISPVVLTAGNAKAPLSTYGEITKDGMEIVQRSLEKIHAAFRKLVVHGRPELADVIEEVADGDIFLGQEARDLKMVDDVMTSEEYIMERVQAGDRVLKLHRVPQFMKNRRLSLHPLDFLKENGPQWLAEQDIPKLVSRVLQTSTFLKFVQYLAQNRLM